MKTTGVSALVLIFAIPSFCPAQAASNAAQRTVIDQFLFPAAMCNDGSAPRYSYALARKVTKKWLIHLKGGASCKDNETCANRWFDVGNTRFDILFDDEIGNHNNMVNAEAPINYSGLGIVDFNTSYGINPFQDVNRLYVHYCSSDNWKGRGGTQPTTQPPDSAFASIWGEIQASRILSKRYAYLEPPDYLRFSGADIIDAIVDIVKTGTYELGGSGLPDVSRRPDDATAEIILTGSSAGSIGVTTNLDRVADKFRNPAQTGILPNGLPVPGGVPEVMVYGVMDSANPAGALPDFLADALANDTTATYWGGGNPRNVAIDESCDAAEMQPGGNPDRCYDTGFVIRDYIETPYFVAENSFDQVIHGPHFDLRKQIYISQGMSDADASVQASADLRAGVTSATAGFGVLQGNFPGLYIPNYFDGQFTVGGRARGVHQLMADTDRFWNAPSSLKGGLTSPNLTVNPRPPDLRSFASALQCFRAALVAPALVPVICTDSNTVEDARVVNEQYQ